MPLPEDVANGQLEFAFRRDDTRFGVLQDSAIRHKLTLARAATDYLRVCAPAHIMPRGCCCVSEPLNFQTEYPRSQLFL